jgi:hypothetical protein
MELPAETSIHCLLAFSSLIVGSRPCKDPKKPLFDPEALPYACIESQREEKNTVNRLEEHMM